MKRVVLSNEEFKAVAKIAHETRMDESWFSIMTTDEGDCVYDMERRRKLTLVYGLKQIVEGIAYSLSYYGMSADEANIFIVLLDRLGIKHEGVKI